jgi:hypothetical protein
MFQLSVHWEMMRKTVEFVMILNLNATMEGAFVMIGHVMEWMTVVMVQMRISQGVIINNQPKVSIDVHLLPQCIPTGHIQNILLTFCAL